MRFKKLSIILSAFVCVLALLAGCANESVGDEYGTIAEIDGNERMKYMTNFTEELKTTDLEFTALFDRFAFTEAAGMGKLDSKTKFVAILAALLGCQGLEEFKIILPIALDNDVTPVEAKEIIYQATAYLGIGKTYPFLAAANEVMTKKGIQLPLEPQTTTTHENRREAGTGKQIELFGEGMKDFWQGSDINYLLAANCFGDYYTRGGLNNAQRELVTFCYLAAQGGCESQLTGHTAANMAQGNDKTFLMDVVTQMVPYIGYPRCLNAINVINQVAENSAKKSKKYMDKEAFEKVNMFKTGVPNEAFAQYFIGNSYLNVLNTPSENMPLAFVNVTFEPGCRNNWHIHTATKGGGQVLICTAGEGWYQEEGKEAVSLKEGSLIIIPANVKHWHGAKAGNWFSHISLVVPGDNGGTDWLEPVSDEEYGKL